MHMSRLKACGLEQAGETRVGRVEDKHWEEKSWSLPHW